MSHMRRSACPQGGCPSYPRSHPEADEDDQQQPGQQQQPLDGTILQDMLCKYITFAKQQYRPIMSQVGAGGVCSCASISCLGSILGPAKKAMHCSCLQLSVCRLQALTATTATHAAVRNHPFHAKPCTNPFGQTLSAATCHRQVQVHFEHNSLCDMS
jgi:hypothetical protein